MNDKSETKATRSYTPLQEAVGWSGLVAAMLGWLNLLTLHGPEAVACFIWVFLVDKWLEKK